jgi:hypothetical protein
MFATERDNCLVWDGTSPGHYEVYYLKLNHRESGCAWWLRYTLLAPCRGKGDPVAELWAISFDPGNPSQNRAFKQTFPVRTEARWQTDPFALAIGPAAILRHGSALGAIDGEDGGIAWDLRWEPYTETLYHFPFSAMYRWPLPKTKFLSPNVDVRFYGTIHVGDHTFELNGEPGQQSHIWGTKHAHRWVWASCNAFTEHGEGSFFEGLSAQVKLGPFTTPFATFLALKLDGELIELGGLWTAFRTRSDMALPVWQVHATGKDIELSGRISARIEDFVGVEYTDPDGEKLWCNNTKVADCEIKILCRKNGRMQEPIILTAQRTAALEFVAHEKDPRIPIRV